MNKKISIQCLLMLSVLMISIFIVSPVYADDAPPPVGTEDSAPVTDTSSEENVEGTESTPPVESEASESAITDSSSEENVELIESAPQESVAEIIEQLPVETEVIILDENGEALPLASEQAEEAIIIKDPIWCPVGVAPKPGVGGCSNSFPNLSTLVVSFVPPAKNGVIWIEAGTDNGSQVEIDGEGAWFTAANYSLTLQGGWIGGTTGSTAIVGTTIFDTAISIVGWKGTVTVNDIAFENANNTLNPGTGALYVETTKNIVVSNVMATNSTGSGAYLDNRNSTTQASVTVKNSTFNNNTTNGLTILSDGAITLTNVSTHFNTVGGANLSNNYDAPASVVSVTKGFFNENGLGDGLAISSNGAVKLSQITAFANSSRGVFVNNTSSLTPQPVTLSGYLHASNNGGKGLDIVAGGAVTLTSLITDFNGNIGTDIDNTYFNAYAVTINGTNSMSGNTAGGGLTIDSWGAITLNNITANANNGRGASINNADGTLPYAVHLKGVNSFSQNTQNGLTISSRGTINLYNVTANENGFLLNLSGVLLYNQSDPLKPYNINLFGVNTFNANANTGLDIYSYGTITLNNVTASYNGYDVNDGVGSGAIISNVGSSTSSKPVVLKGTNIFNGNQANGLSIFTSGGSIVVSNLTASDNNGGYGAYLYNLNSQYQSPVTINGYGVFNNNFLSGLYIRSNGVVTTTNLSALSNDSIGVLISTVGLSKPQSVTLKGNNTFINNGDGTGEHGLYVLSDGNITVNNLTASQNYANGAYLDNYTLWESGSFTTFGSITITGFGNFHRNTTVSGLFVNSNGNVNLSYITANQNAIDGIGIYANGNVTLTCVLAIDNFYGVRMYAPAFILTMKGVSAVANNSNELLLYSSLVRSRCP